MVSKFTEESAEPKVHPGNPGKGTRGKFAFQNGTQQYSEDVDLIEVLREVLAKGGWTAHRQSEWLLADSGLWLQPRLVGFSCEDESVLTSTTIEVAHPLMLPEPCFEYQHSVGETAAKSLRAGFERWARMDWLVFNDLLVPSLSHCTTLEMSFPGKNGSASDLQRRVLLGPVEHMVSKAAPAGSQEEEHPFCPCCLVTNTLEAFMPQLKSGGTFGLRLYAARDASGQLQADCRVNGEDWPSGAQALQAYAATWPDRGLEWRKQYVMIGPNPDQNE